MPKLGFAALNPAYSSLPQAGGGRQISVPLQLCGRGIEGEGSIKVVILREAKRSRRIYPLHGFRDCARNDMKAVVRGHRRMPSLPASLPASLPQAGEGISDVG
jgi:hypothetical protein